MLDRDANQAEVDRNLEAFREKLPELMESAPGKFVLIRHREIIGLFDTLMDALTAGKKLYSDRLFSIQEIKDRPIDLGFFSHALHLG